MQTWLSLERHAFETETIEVDPAGADELGWRCRDPARCASLAGMF